MSNWFVLGLALVVAFGPAAVYAQKVDLARIAASWPARFDMQGAKIEPTWIEYVRLRREGDRFTLEGGGLHGYEQAVESVEVDARGRIRRLRCPAAMDCKTVPAFAGFLASAQFLARHRAGLLAGHAPVVAFGDWKVFCVPGEKLGIDGPILDPCFELRTGAIVAQRARTDGSWSGPTLEPVSIRFR